VNDESLILRAAELDKQGFLPLPGESPEAFFERFELSERAYCQFEE
jgi:hypothetical protein